MLLQVGRITYILTFLMYSFFLLQDSIFAVDGESEECKNFHEYVDIKHEIKPIPELPATTETTSEVRHGCECCKFNHIYTYSDNLFLKYSKQKN